MIKEDTGKFVISLDFELYWGLRDVLPLEEYRERLDNTRKIVPRLLALFENNGIRATWATVGFLLAGTKAELLAAMPPRRPQYRNPAYSPYRDCEKIGHCEDADPYHFAPSLVKKIVSTKGQEIGSHTLSHYYALEDGQGIEEFAADLRANLALAAKSGISLKSLVLPRNQLADAYRPAIEECGFRVVRGNQPGFLHRAKPENRQNRLIRALRLLDSYLPLSPSAIYLPGQGRLVNLPASRFLRPYEPRLRLLEGLKLRRIKSEMGRAARQKKVYHLWWHPHNFGLHQEKNLENLQKILDFYCRLNRDYGFSSRNMGDFAR